MKRFRKSLLPFLLVTMFMAGVLSGCTIVALDSGEILFGGKAIEGGSATAFDDEFSPDVYIESIWEEQALPIYEKNAVALLDILTGVETDFDQATEDFAVLSSDKSCWVFTAKGVGVVESIDTQSRSGTALMKIEGIEQPVLMQIGPVYKGATLREALGFIKFSDFKNQVVFSEISSALNRKADTSVVAPSGLLEAQGKTVQFVGTFSLKTAQDEILITPVLLEVGAN